MGLKAFIQTQINDYIRNKTPKVVKVEHATVEDSLLSGMFGTPEYFNTGALTAPDWLVDATPNYPVFDAVVTKSGNMVKMTGKIANRSGSTVFGHKMFKFVEGTDRQYLPDDTVALAGVPKVYYGKAWNPNAPATEVQFYIGKNNVSNEYVFYVEGSFPYNTNTGFYRFEITYISKY